MCTETHHRFRRCFHTHFHRWDYCSVLIPAERIPSTGRACRKYKLRCKQNQDPAHCLECVKERAIADMDASTLDLTRQWMTEETRGSKDSYGERVKGWLREVFGRRGQK